MKNQLLLILLAFSGLAHAQIHYQLFRPGVQYLYTHELPVSEYTSSLLGIWIGEEECTILYESLQPNVPAADPECLVRVPAFVGSEVCQTAAATLLNLGSDESPYWLTLHPDRAVGASWLATTDSVYAKVESVSWTQVLGLPDSVKSINLYRAEAGELVPLYATPVLRVSRSYGLVTADFLHWLGVATGGVRLTGMSAPAAGTQDPRREDVFTLSPGDPSHVTEVRTVLTDNSFYHEYQDKQNVLLDDGFLPDSYRYFAYRGDRKIYQTGPAAAADTLWLTDRADTVIVPWPDLTYLNEQAGALIDSPDYPESRQVVGLGHAYLCDRPAKRLGSPILVSNEECAVTLFDVAPNPDYYADYGGPYFRYMDLGGLRYRDFVYAAPSEGVPCGTPFDFVVATRSVTEASWRAWPNPVRDVLNLSGDGRLRVLDALGRVRYAARAAGPLTQLDLAHLPGGNYYLHLVTPQGETTVIKLVKE